ncbi:MAG: glutamate-5-semialdehyde dehydrogenase [Bacteroidota bacterium]
MNTATLSSDQILEDLAAIRKVSRKLISVSNDTIRDVLYDLAELAVQESDFLLAENQKDLDRMDSANPKYDRLLLNEKRLEQIASELRKVADLPSPLNRTLEERRLENGMHLRKVSVPLGVVGIVFESRPNVTFDVFALCLKSGNASVLKGSRDAHFSNLAILKLINQVLSKKGLEGICYLAPSEREVLGTILSADQYIDIIIPRGGQGLINYVREHSKVPVIETGAGIVHAYFDASADLKKGTQIVTNAKSRRVSVCNALDSLVIHRERLNDLPTITKDLGLEHNCRIHADEEAFEILKAAYPEQLLHKATPDSFGTEFLSMQLSIKTVSSIEEAIEHVSHYSSKHSETIIAEDESTISKYLNEIDAAVVYANASTAFTDGAQFGMGAEIGISTQKLHARGPMALNELTSYKWQVRGNGNTRK